jgi:hypothetical protein
MDSETSRGERHSREAGGLRDHCDGVSGPRLNGWNGSHPSGPVSRCIRAAACPVRNAPSGREHVSGLCIGFHKALTPKLTHLPRRRSLLSRQADWSMAAGLAARLRAHEETEQRVRFRWPRPDGACCRGCVWKPSSPPSALGTRSGLPASPRRVCPSPVEQILMAIVTSTPNHLLV